jgi:flagellin-like hook-associated protein FlgL
MSNSINTNYAAQTALQSLNNINKNMLTTQNRISTGLRVATAQDSAAYWSMATSMRADNKSLSAVNDALGIGAAMIDVAYTGMNAAIDVVKEMGSLLVAARQPGVNRGDIQTEIDELQNQLRTIATSASIAGQDLARKAYAIPTTPRFRCDSHPAIVEATQIQHRFDQLLHRDNHHLRSCRTQPTQGTHYEVRQTADRVVV